MEFGCIFAGQRPQVHEQYAGGAKNPNPVARTDAEVFETILRGAELAEQLGFDSVWVTEHGFSEHSIISSPTASWRPSPRGPAASGWPWDVP